MNSNQTRTIAGIASRCVAAALLAVASSCDDTPSATDASPMPVDAAIDSQSDAPGDANGLTTVTVTTYRRGTFDPGDTANAQLAAIQDGDGAWRPLFGTNGVYTEQVIGPRYAVAIGCIESTTSGAYITIVHTTTAERTAHNLIACNATPSASVPVRVALQNAPPYSYAYSALSAATSGTSTLEFMTVPHRSDLLVLHSDGNGEVAAHRINDGDLTVPQEYSIDASQGSLLVNSGLTLAPLASDERGNLTASIHRNSGVAFRREFFLRLGFFTFTSADQPSTYRALPVALRRSGDLEQVQYSNTTARGNRRIARYTDGSTALTMTLPPFFEPPGPVLTQTPYTRPAFSFAPVNGSDGAVAYILTTYSLGRSPGSVFHYWSIEISQGWVDGASSVQYTIPDLSGIAGWNSAFELREHDGVYWNTARHVRQQPQVGAVITSASRSGVVGEYCGDGILQSWEACDDVVESVGCDRDCTLTMCGDGIINYTAGESCDPPDGASCSSTCVFIDKQARRPVAPQKQPAVREFICDLDSFAPGCAPTF